MLKLLRLHQILDGGAGPLDLPKDTQIPAVIKPVIEPGKPGEDIVDPNKPVVDPNKVPDPEKPPVTPEVKTTPGEEPKKPEETDGERYQARFQTMYQDAMTFLDDNHPEVREEVGQFLNPGAPPETPPPAPPPAPAAAVPAAVPAVGAAKRDLTQPDQFLDELDQRFDLKLNAVFEKQKVDTRAASLVKEKENAANGFRKFIDAKDPKTNEYIIPVEVVKQAVKNVKKYRIDDSVPGGPTGMVRALIEHINWGLTQRGFAKTVTKAEAEASRITKATLLTAQPAPAGTVTPGEKTKNEKHLVKLQTVGGSSVNALMEQNK